jgi:hypothetical protein
VRDHAYDVGSSPNRSRHASIASRTLSRVHLAAIAPGRQVLQYS